MAALMLGLFADGRLDFSGRQAAGSACRRRCSRRPGEQGPVPLGAPPALHGGAGLYLADSGDDCQLAGDERWPDALLIVGAIFEERKLLSEFGQAYIDYRKSTPMLVPGLGWRHND